MLVPDFLENAIHQPMRVVIHEILAQLDGLVDDHPMRDFRAKAQLVHAEAQDVANGHGESIEPPVVETAADAAVNVLAVIQGAHRQFAGEVPHLFGEFGVFQKAIHRLRGFRFDQFRLVERLNGVDTGLVAHEASGLGAGERLM